MLAVISIVLGLILVVSYAITEDANPNMTMALIGVGLIATGLLL